MKVMMLVQEKCNVDHPDEDKAECPGFSSETRLQIVGAQSVYEAVRAITEQGARVITAFPARTAMGILGSALESEWTSAELRGDFLGGRYTSEMSIPPGFYAGSRGSRAPEFYLDPRADSQPVENPNFRRETEEMPRPFQKRDRVRFEIPEDASDWHWRDAIHASDDADIEEVKTSVRDRFGEYYVVFASHGERLGLADMMGVAGRGAPTIQFSCYPCFVTLVDRCC